MNAADVVIAFGVVVLVIGTCEVLALCAAARKKRPKPPTTESPEQTGSAEAERRPKPDK